MTIAEAPVVLCPPTHLWVPPRVGSYGDEVVDLADAAGVPVDPEQRLAIDAISSYGEGGRWAALEAAIVEGRQNGKTDGVILPVVLADMFLFDNEPDQITWTAHLFHTTRKSFARLTQIIEGNAFLSRRVKKISEGRGEESIILHNNTTVEFLARSKGGGRGLGGKRVVLDEALFLPGTSLGALIPTLSARPNPQVLYGSSAGVAESVHLRSLRNRGRAGGDPSLVWAEWTSKKGGCRRGDACSHVFGVEGCALDDEDRWFQANHAIARERITLRFVRGERRTLPWEEFARERCGWWDDPLGEDVPIDVVQWGSLATPRRRRPANATPMFFVDVQEDLRSAAIAVAFEVRGKPHVDLADHRQGTSWLVARAGVLDRRYAGAGWAIHSGGAAGAFVPELEELGIEPQTFTTPDMGRACAHLQKLIAGAKVSHSGDDAFSVALGGAIRRNVGDGLWIFERRKSSTDVTPLNAVAGALWALEAFDPGDDFAAVI